MRRVISFASSPQSPRATSTTGVSVGSSPLWQGVDVTPLLLINDCFNRPPFLLTVFAYGATGAGKTYTMLGLEKSPGIMYLTMMELYRRIEAREGEKSYEVLVSYQEVCCGWVEACPLLCLAHHCQDLGLIRTL